MVLKNTFLQTLEIAKKATMLTITKQCLINVHNHIHISDIVIGISLFDVLWVTGPFLNRDRQSTDSAGQRDDSLFWTSGGLTRRPVGISLRWCLGPTGGRSCVPPDEVRDGPGGKIPSPLWPGGWPHSAGWPWVQWPREDTGRMQTRRLWGQ